MDLFADPEPVAVGVSDRPPGGLTRPEHAQGNADLAAALGDPPDDLARALAAAVWRLRPAALQKVARLVIQETQRGNL